MKAFISYASEHRDVAQRVALGLRNAGHAAFFGREALVAGDDFEARIREALHDSDVFIFLASAEALRPGGYPLAELALAQTRWPRPAGQVIPVLLDDTALETLP